MSDKPIKEYPLQTAIELSCAAMRVNGGYVKEIEAFADYNAPGYKFPNKELMLIAMGEVSSNKYEDHPNKPHLLCTNKDDQALTNDIRQFYKRLLFTAIDGSDEFRTTLFSVMSKDMVQMNRMGFIACLPSAYMRDRYDMLVKRASPGFVADIGCEVVDKDCDIIRVSRSKTYDAWNIDAIIDEKLVSWMTSKQVSYGPAVILQGKVKDHSKHWQHPIDVTRMNYVKVFQ